MPLQHSCYEALADATKKHLREGPKTRTSTPRNRKEGNGEKGGNISCTVGEKVVTLRARKDLLSQRKVSKVAYGIGMPQSESNAQKARQLLGRVDRVMLVDNDGNILCINQ